MEPLTSSLIIKGVSLHTVNTTCPKECGVSDKCHDGRCGKASLCTPQKITATPFRPAASVPTGRLVDSSVWVLLYVVVYSGKYL